MARVLKRLHTIRWDVILTCASVSMSREEPIRSVRKVFQQHRRTDLRATKRRIRPMLGFKKFGCARILLSGIELMHMINKGQMKTTSTSGPLPPNSLAP